MSGGSLGLEEGSVDWVGVGESLEEEDEPGLLDEGSFIVMMNAYMRRHNALLDASALNIVRRRELQGGTHLETSEVISAESRICCSNDEQCCLVEADCCVSSIFPTYRR